MDSTPVTGPPVVLIVEDNLEQRTLLREFLADVLTCDLREAGDGDAALGAVRCCRPDLVLLDLHIPPAGGMQVLQTLRADALLSDVPVIVLSGSRLPADIARVEAAGACRYIEKPYDLDELETAVLAALRPPTVA